SSDLSVALAIAESKSRETFRTGASGARVLFGTREWTNLSPGYVAMESAAIRILSAPSFQVASDPVHGLSQWTNSRRSKNHRPRVDGLDDGVSYLGQRNEVFRVRIPELSLVCFVPQLVVLYFALVVRCNSCNKVSPVVKIAW